MIEIDSKKEGNLCYQYDMMKVVIIYICTHVVLGCSDITRIGCHGDCLQIVSGTKDYLEKKKTLKMTTQMDGIII